MLVNHNVVVVLISSLSFIRGGVGASERLEPIWEAKTSEAHHEVSYLECMAVATASTWVTSGRLSGSGVMQSATTALSKYFKIDKTSNLVGKPHLENSSVRLGKWLLTPLPPQTGNVHKHGPHFKEGRPLVRMLQSCVVASSHPSTGLREAGGSRTARSSCTASTGSSCHLEVYNILSYYTLVSADLSLVLSLFATDHRTVTEGRPFHKEDIQGSRCPT